MTKLNQITIPALMLAAPLCGLSASQVIYHTPSNHQLMAVSPNGNWGCGVFLDANNNTYAFRWNLLSGSIEMLSSVEQSIAWDVADDGTVAGNFADTSILDNHAPLQMVGYYRDGSWHSVEMPSGTITDGLGYGITPDGHYMSGSVEVNGKFTPIIWKDGKIDRILLKGVDAMPYAISPDGKAAAGWKMEYNRVATYWPGEGDPMTFTDSPDYSFSPWNCGKAFTLDGKKMLYWGGWELEKNNDLYLYAIYDIETGEKKRIKAPSYDSDMEFFDIASDCTLFGGNLGRAYVYVADGDSCCYIDEYLKMRGADLSGFTDMYVGDEWDDATLPIWRAISTSADANTLGLLYWDLTTQSSSMVVRLNVDTENCPASDIAVKQLNGLYNVGVSWSHSLQTSGCSYNVYRDGKKVSSMLGIRNTYFYDKNVTPGVHEYTVERVTPSGTKTMSEPIEIEVKELTASAPRQLLSRQKGFNSAYASWREPLSNMTNKTYCTEGELDLQGFTVYQDMVMEAAIKFDSHELDNYAGQAIREVSFYPIAQHKSWTVNIYSEDADGKLTLVTSQPVTQQLEYGVRNTVKLDSPVALPVSGNIIAAICVDVDSNNPGVLGAEMGPMKPGYSDLLRDASEETFFSAYDSSLATGYSCTCMTFAISISIAPDSYSEADNKFDHYAVCLDGATTVETTDTNITFPSLADGDHTIEVKAVYADGRVSAPLTSTFTMAAAFKAINDVKVEAAEGNAQAMATWTAPVDNDRTDISYTTQASSTSGLHGTSSNGYAIQAACIYPTSMLKGYDGYRISALRYYPLTDAIFTLFLYENGEEVAYIEVDDYTVGEWNEVALPEDVFVKPGCEYQYVVDCFDPVPGASVLAIDNMVGILTYSDLYSINNGESFSAFGADTGLNANWMMGMVIESPEASDITVNGYDVVIDGKKRNADPVTANEYTFDMTVDTSNHFARIDTYYSVLPEVVKGKTTIFRLGSSGIADNMIAEIELRQGSNHLIAEGDNVTAVTVYSATGVQSAYAEGSTVDISALTPGVYVVKIDTTDGPATRKVVIR